MTIWSSVLPCKATECQNCKVSAIKMQCSILPIRWYQLWGLLNIHVSIQKDSEKPGPAVIKLFSCSTQLSIKFILLINVEMPTLAF